MRKLVTALSVVAGLIAIAGLSVTVRAASMSGTSLPAKDQARMAFDETPATERDYGGALMQLAQAARPLPPPNPPDGLPHGPAREAGPFAPPMRMAMHAPPPPPITRAACEEGINRHAAMAGYIKSKLNLQGSQKDAWRKIEEAAEPAVAKMRDVCAQLPATVGPPPSLPDVIDFEAKQMQARAAFLSAVSAPAHALYETLSADQRTALVPPPAPPF